MKKKTIIVIVILFVVLLIGFKLVTYYRYYFPKPDNVEDIVKGFKNPNTISIKKTELPSNEYKSLDYLKIKDIFDGYEENEAGEYYRFQKRSEKICGNGKNGRHHCCQ